MELLNYSYKQKNSWTCGPAVARIILYYFGKRTDIQQIIRQLRTSRSGTSNASVKKLFKKNGLKFVEKKTATLGDIRKRVSKNWIIVAYHIPCHKEDHYSIVKKIDSRRIYFHDTWFGSGHSYTHQYFLKNWRDGEAKRWFLAVKK